MHTSPRISL